jgi:hypothetical protein
MGPPGGPGDAVELCEDGVPLARPECPRALFVALERLVGPLLERGWVAERAVGGVKLVQITEDGRGVLDGFDDLDGAFCTLTPQFFRE